MARNTKKKLAIFAGTSKCLVYAEAKYCASEMPGEIKYYECSRTEYCCAFGCCVSPGLHFHHLWYYWVLVIIMFMVCSGGGWWYRYWLQGRYRAAASAIPTRSSNTRSQNSLRNTPCQAQQARISYNSARNTVLLHRPQRSAAAPAYNGNATTSTHYQNMNVVLNDANCPYYQLYGPPPSYETVIAQTRGKISNSSTSSPESSTARLNLQTANVIPNPSVPQCFFYTCNAPSRLVDGNVNQCQSDDVNTGQTLDGHEGVPFAHFSQYCATNGAVSQNLCVPLEYPEAPAASNNFARGYQSGSTPLPGYPTDGLSDASDAENAAHGYAMQSAKGCDMTLGIDAATGGYGERASWSATVNDRSPPTVHGKINAPDEGDLRVSQRRCATSATRMHAQSPKLEASSSGDENESRRTSFAITATFRERSFSRERANYGGSLRLPRGHVGGGTGFQGVSPGELRDSDGERGDVLDLDSGTATAESVARNANSIPERAAVVDGTTSSCQSNPSNNVILETFIFKNAPPSSESAEEARGPRAMNRSTNFDLESKYKLDRSKSL